MIFYLFILFCHFIILLLIKEELRKCNALSSKISYPQKSASIIISVYNEAKNINQILRLCLEQIYDDFEIIVVNDGSNDKTLDILNKIENENHRHLKIIHLSKNRGKKIALEIGLRLATKDYVILTDGDCVPQSKYWVAQMLNRINENTKIVAGFAPFFVTKEKVNLWARYENFLTAFQFFGFGLCGLPYMATGRNVTYEKETLKKVGYFKGHSNILAGDDDLTIQSMLKHTKMDFILDKETHIYSQAPTSWRSYLNQKRRHYSVSRFYPFVVKFFLSIFMAFWALAILLGLFFLFYELTLVKFGIILILALLPSYLLWRSNQYFNQCIKFYECYLFWWIYPFVISFISLIAQINLKKTWK